MVCSASENVACLPTSGPSLNAVLRAALRAASWSSGPAPVAGVRAHRLGPAWRNRESTAGVCVAGLPNLTRGNGANKLRGGYRPSPAASGGLPPSPPGPLSGCHSEFRQGVFFVVRVPCPAHPQPAKRVHLQQLRQPFDVGPVAHNRVLGRRVGRVRVGRPNRNLMCQVGTSSP